MCKTNAARRTEQLKSFTCPAIYSFPFLFNCPFLPFNAMLDPTLVIIIYTLSAGSSTIDHRFSSQHVFRTLFRSMFFYRDYQFPIGDSSKFFPSISNKQNESECYPRRNAQCVLPTEFLYLNLSGEWRVYVYRMKGKTCE